MCKEKETNSESNGEKKQRKPLPQAFTPMTAKQAQEASVRARNLRKQMRAQILQAAVDEGIDKLFRKALKSSDLDQMALIEKALKLTGLDFGSSEEAVNKLQVDAKTDNKTELSGQIEFVIPTK
jgi:hypothetical protein